MSLQDKIANAKKTSWVTKGLEAEEVKTIVELAKISAKIELARLDLGMTQKEFAEYMGVTQGMISKWESREYNFTIKSLNEICEKLNLQCNVDIFSRDSRVEYIPEKWQKEKFTRAKGFRLIKNLDSIEGIA